MSSHSNITTAHTIPPMSTTIGNMDSAIATHAAILASLLTRLGIGLLNFNMYLFHYKTCVYSLLQFRNKVVIFLEDNTKPYAPFESGKQT